jgi:hypothetical protein
VSRYFSKRRPSPQKKVRGLQKKGGKEAERDFV